MKNGLVSSFEKHRKQKKTLNSENNNSVREHQNCVFHAFKKMFIRTVFKNKNQTCPWPLFVCFFFFFFVFCRIILPNG